MSNSLSAAAPTASGGPVRIGIVGVGKIARDQHLPAIAGSGAFTLAGTADARPGEGVRYASLDAMIAGVPDLQAVAICTPPQGRAALVREALAAGLHVMIEKPPVATAQELAALAAEAEGAGLTLFAAWHSREAHGVARARDWLAGRTVHRAAIRWREDIRHWHPGQDWILAEGGLGVFDPGINALSILTAILPGAWRIARATLDIPANRQSPIRVDMALAGPAPVAADFDFLQTGEQTWEIAVESDAGTMRLTQGGAVLHLPGEPADSGVDREYPRLYARFADLIAAGRSDADGAPLALVTAALDGGERRPAAPFAF